VRLDLRRSGSFIGMAGMAPVGFLYLASGLVAPGWAVVLLCLFWVALLVLGFRWFMTRPLHVLALPFVALAVWFGAITAGAALLGWNA
jgi:hypothetical protein